MFKSMTLRRAAGWLVALLIIFFLGRTLWSSWDQVQASGFQFTLTPLPLAVSLVLLVIGRSFAVEAWRRILLALGDYVSFRFAFYAWFISNLARFIPGNVWQLAAMMVLVERQGVSRLNVLLSQAVYAVIALSVAALYGIAFLPVVQPAFEASGYLLLLVVVFIALIVFFALPPVFQLMVTVATWALSRVRRSAAYAPPQLPHTSFWRGLIPPLCSTAMWTINGIAYWLFVSSLTPLPLDALPSFAAINAAAYFIGYASFITPSGLGFREGAMVLMLQAFFPPPVAVAIAFLARIWSIAGEMLGVGLAVWGAPRTPPVTHAENALPSVETTR